MCRSGSPKQRGDYTCNVFHRDRRRLALAERQVDPICFPDRIGSENQEEAFEKHCRPHVHDRQTRPVQRLLGQPVQLVLRARSRFGNAHL
jgi:hypothetical protein